MTVTTRIAYLFDPLCGWCYGASAVLAGLVARPECDVELVPTGLFAGPGAQPMDDRFAAYAWSNDQRIARLTGRPFRHIAARCSPTAPAVSIQARRRWR